MSAPLLLLHGALGSADQFKPLLPLLGTRVVYTYNFMGHGGRDITANFSIEGFVNELAAWLNTERLNEVDIFGYSMGGYVGLQLAAIRPERIGAVMTLGTMFDWSPERAAKEVAMLNPDKIAAKVPKFAAALAMRHAPTDWHRVTTETAAMLTNLGNKPTLNEAMLRTVSCPVFICRADADQTVSAAESNTTADVVQQGKYLTLSDSQHPFEQISLPGLAALIDTCIPYNHDH